MPSPLDSPSQSELILSLLYQGKRVSVSFPSASLRETFRKKLYKRKAAQDEAIVQILEEDKKALRCFYEQFGENFSAIFWLAEKKVVEFPFNVLDLEEGENGQTT